MASGNGRCAIVLATMGYETSAYELTNSGIKVIQKNSAIQNVHVNCKKVDFIAESFVSEKFNVVVSSGLYEEIPLNTHELATKRFVQSCLPGGTIVLRYCTEIKGRGVLAKSDVILEHLEANNCVINYFNELQDFKISKANFELKHATILAKKIY
ncbi:MAG: class I SAM-dependent methyltransferase [Bacteroidota bacterium]